MTELPIYGLSARVSACDVEARIERADGASVSLSPGEFSALILDLAVDETGAAARAAHQHEVLAQWFARKFQTLTTRPALRVVRG